MPAPLIEVVQLSKVYRRGVTGHGTLRQDLQSWWARFRGRDDPNEPVRHKLSSTLSEQHLRFWALKDVSFTVESGDVVGIIGRNGAGKSTLLKILSRITAPSSGRALLRGRVASLLEVGTGFHPELTGRENIYLNGAILGMPRAETRSKLDRIIDFSGISQFIDTPVKRYSSGMRVRLAFSVAAHLDPDIMIVDEVLAVGDAEFQKKCLGRMQDFSTDTGRAVLFVSHDLHALQSICTRGMLIEDGMIDREGTIDGIAHEYLGRINPDLYSPTAVSRLEAPRHGIPYIEEFYVTSGGGDPTYTVRSGAPMELHFRYRNPTGRAVQPELTYLLSDRDGNRLFCCAPTLTGQTPTLDKPAGEIICRIDRLALPPGDYMHTFSIVNQGQTWQKKSRFGALNVIDGDFFASGRLPDRALGLTLQQHSWTAL